MVRQRTRGYEGIRAGFYFANTMCIVVFDIGGDPGSLGTAYSDIAYPSALSVRCTTARASCGESCMKIHAEAHVISPMQMNVA